MSQLTTHQWRSRIKEIAANPIVNADNQYTWKQALVRGWKLFCEAPDTIQAQFSNISEQDLCAEDDKIYLQGDDAPVDLHMTESTSVLDCLKQIGGWLRATERKIFEARIGRRVSDPNQEWLVQVDGNDYLLAPMPRSLWRSPPGSAATGKPFTRRALLRYRVIPKAIGGIPVRIEMPRYQLPPRKIISFTASLFAGVEFEEDKDDESFVITAVTSADQKDMADHIVLCAKADAAVHVLPELMVDLKTRATIAKTLAHADWISGSPESKGPDFVVAGSWHVQDSTGIRNEAIVYGHDGKELLRFHKFFRYRDPEGRHERIEPGEELVLLVTPSGLFGFGICLDLCNRLTPILRNLDVDWMVVPSCGDGKTMTDHVEAAATIQARYDGRSFVVQQAWPNRKDGGLGYVLPAPTTLRDLTDENLVVSQSFSKHVVVPPSRS